MLGGAVGVVEVGDCVLVELEDVTRGYRRPSIVDIKVRPCFASSQLLPTSTRWLAQQTLSVLVVGDELGLKRTGGLRDMPVFHHGPLATRPELQHMAIVDVARQQDHAWPYQTVQRLTRAAPQCMGLLPRGCCDAWHLVQVGFRTWYHDADPCHIERCKLKDAATSQAALGFKICGMQVTCACPVCVCVSLGGAGAGGGGVGFVDPRLGFRLNPVVCQQQGCSSPASAAAAKEQ